MWCYRMFNMDKITRTKLAMLVTLVLLNIFTTIGLVYTMAVSHVTSFASGTPGNDLNMAMIFAIIIAFMWVVALILFHEFKTDDILKTHIHKLETHIVQLEEFKATMVSPLAINPDVLKEGGIQGHVVPPK
jgi:hypothetical protein